MVMKKIFLLTAFLCFVFVSCNQQNRNKAVDQGALNGNVEKESGIVQYKVDNSRVPDIADISDLVADVTIIPLVEEPGNNIGDVWKIIVLNNHYVVFDFVQSHKILLFSGEGKYIKTILKTGKGPNETITLTDCWAADFKELEAYDRTLRQTYTFDTLFNLKRKIKGDEASSYSSFCRIPKTKNYLGYSGYDYNPAFNDTCSQVAFLNENMTIINTDLHIDCKFNGAGIQIFRNQFFQYKDSLRFFKTYDNYIYHVSYNAVIPFAKISYTENEIPEDFLSQTISENVDRLKQMPLTREAINDRVKPFEKYAYLQGWLENKNFIHLTSMDLEKWHSSIIDKASRRDIYTAKKFSETQKYKVIFPRFVCYDPVSDSFIGYVNGFTLKDHLLPGSKFLEEIKPDPASIYLFKVKLNK